MAEETTFVPVADPAMGGVDPASFALGAQVADTNIVDETAVWALNYTEPTVEAQALDAGAVVTEGSEIVSPIVGSNGGTSQPTGGNENEEGSGDGL